MMPIIDGSFPLHNTESWINGIGDSNSCAGCIPIPENGGAAIAVGIGIGIGIAVAIAFRVCGKA